MQIDSSNYNTLGRIGPLQSRPEYHPGQSLTKGTGSEVSSESEQKQQTKDVVRRATSERSGDSRLSLQGVRRMTEETSLMIMGQNPSSTANGPHRVSGLGLIYPQYV